MQQRTHIRFHGDVTDPYSYLGRAQFDQAHAEYGGAVFDIETAPFETNPDLPVNGMEFDQFLLARYGDQAAIAKLFLPLSKSAECEGLELALDKIKLMPNSHAAHRILGWARELGADYALYTRLQRAHFALGLDIGNRAVLRAQADAVGLDGASLLMLLDRADGADSVPAEIASHAKAGIKEVPAWVIGGTYVVRGVQTVDFWREVIGEIDAKGRELAKISTN